MFESLEQRQLLSAAPSIHADAVFSTRTAIYITNQNSILGQRVTIKGVVRSSGGADAGATIELFDNGKNTGLVGLINSKGDYVFDLDAGHAEYIGKQLWSVRVLDTANFTGSKSRQVLATVKAPVYTSESNGLKIANVSPGKGTATAKSGDTVVIQYSLFDGVTGAIYDESDNYSPSTFQFVVNAVPNTIIKGVSDEVIGMTVGETRVAVIPPKLGYPKGVNALSGLKLVFVLRLTAIT